VFQFLKNEANLPAVFTVVNIPFIRVELFNVTRQEPVMTRWIRRLWSDGTHFFKALGYKIICLCQSSTEDV
jgi:hypothetical protein